MNRFTSAWKKIPAWLFSAVTGAVIGAGFAVGGGLRSRWELLPGERHTYELTEFAVLGAATGAVGGLVYWATGSLRRRGGWRFFFAWGLVGLGALGIVAIPLLMVDFSLFWLIFWLLAGPGAGIGLAFTEREIRR